MEATVYPHRRIVYRTEHREEVQQLLDLANGVREGAPAHYAPPTVSSYPIPAAVSLSEVIKRYLAYLVTVLEHSGAEPQTEAECNLTTCSFNAFAGKSLEPRKPSSKLLHLKLALILVRTTWCGSSLYFVDEPARISDPFAGRSLRGALRAVRSQID